jgi:surfactin synthase thioesterase subunit
VRRRATPTAGGTQVLVTVPQRDAWLSVWTKKPAADVRLFCLPFAGGGASYYYSWSRALDTAPIEVAAAQLPGRETRFREAPVRSMAALVDGLADAMAPRLDRPFWLFGHSLGAIVAYELARAMRDRGLPQPAQLFVSGAPAPSRVTRVDDLHALSDADFIRVMAERYEGIPDEVQRNRELLSLVLPALRGDMTVIETYRYQPAAPLTCDVTALGGDRDPHLDATAFESWRGMTTGLFRSRLFPGGHFYLTDARDEIVQMMRDRLPAHCG